MDRFIDGFGFLDKSQRIDGLSDSEVNGLGGGLFFLFIFIFTPYLGKIKNTN